MRIQLLADSNVPFCSPLDDLNRRVELHNSFSNAATGKNQLLEIRSHGRTRTKYTHRMISHLISVNCGINLKSLRL